MDKTRGRRLRWGLAAVAVAAGACGAAMQAADWDRTTPAVPAEPAYSTTLPVRYHPARAEYRLAQAQATGTAGDPRLAGPEVRQQFKLKHITATDFEAAMPAFAAKPLAGETRADGEYARYQLQVAGHGPLTVAVGRKSGVVELQGAASGVDVWLKLVGTLDVPMSEEARESTRLVRIRKAEPADVRKTVDILKSAAGEGVMAEAPAERVAPRAAPVRNDLVSVFLQAKQRKEAERKEAELQPKEKQPVNQPVDPKLAPRDPAIGAKPPGPGPRVAAGDDDSAVIGPVRIEYIEALDMIVVTGNPRDVEKVTRMIQSLDLEAETSRPVIHIEYLKHVNNEQLSTLVTNIYDQLLSARQGRVTITALVKPNALLMIGRKENVETVVELVKQLDRAVEPDTRVEVFPLIHASASAAQVILQQYFGDTTTGIGQGPAATTRPGLSSRVTVVADYRTNSLIVQASPRDMEEARHILTKLDTPKVAAVNQMRIISLKYSTATELAPVLQQAITGPTQPARTTGQGQGQQNQFQQQQGPQGAGGQGGQGAGSLQQQQQLQARSIMMQLLTVDPQGKKQLSTGYLNDVRITADTRGNAVVVTAPEESMDLIVALIEEMDRLPAASAQIKVFQIINADATRLQTTLETLFGRSQQAGGGQQVALTPFGLQTITGSTEGSTLIPLRFAVEQRSNSVIVSGSKGDLDVVEALLLKLDDSDVRDRQTSVYRLKNVPAVDVATAVNSYLQGQRQVQQIQPNFLSPFEQIEREVIVVAEPDTNSLIISATPRFYKEVLELVERLDERPPMVMIQVLIAEVTLNETDEFGVELGLQDSVLFDRSVNGVPGFNFNNAPLGNNVTGDTKTVGGQSLSNLAVGRVNSELGFGGLVLSASGHSVSALLRALQENRRLEVLSNPKVTTLDNQTAQVQVGARVPRITSSQLAANGATINNTTLDNVGLILQVTPRISPDGLVVMAIAAEKSQLGPIEEGIPISIAPNGDVIRSPQINTTAATTTVMAAHGQTLVLGGLITQTRSTIHRQVPLLGDLPVVGRLFSFDSQAEERTELLFIMTPYIIRKEEDANQLKQVESSRMSWCLADVYKIYGPGGPQGLGFAEGGTPVVYPDLTPGAPQPSATLDGPATGESSRNVTIETLPSPGKTTLPGTTSPGTTIPGTPLNPAPFKPITPPAAAPKPTGSASLPSTLPATTATATTSGYEVGQYDARRSDVTRAYLELGK